MKNPYSLRREHVHSDEVSFCDGLIRSIIEVTRENRGHEEVGYTWERKAYVEAALSHQHGPTIYSLNVDSDDVSAVLKEADDHFQLEKRLIDIYPDLVWRGQQTDHMYWEGQKSILVGRCGGEVVSISCVDVRFVSDDIGSKTKFLSVGIGPFFVPSKLRGRAHSLEMSIALAYFCSVLQTALFQQLPKFGCMGVSVYSDYPEDKDSNEIHPFVLQVHDKLVVVQEMLFGGYLFKHPLKRPRITFLPVTLDC